MKRKLWVSGVAALALGLTVAIAAAATRSGGTSPDRPPFADDESNEGSYLALRSAYVDRLRGIEPGQAVDPAVRSRAIVALEAKQAELRRDGRTGPSWTAIGPAPIPNGQAFPGPNAPTAVSGRVTALAIDPTDSNTVYLGAADGGVWRTTDAGAHWTPIFDGAQSLSIGSLALAPSSPTTLYVGTGEGNGSADSLVGVGLYRIDNAKTAPALVGPINPGGAFTGRSISRILVSPTDAAAIFVSTASGFAGIGGASPPTLANRGVFRSTNATAAAGSVAFTKLDVVPSVANTRVKDIAFVNNEPTKLLVGAATANATNDGIYRSANALDASPTFTKVKATPASSRISFAVTGNTALAETDEAASGSNSGRLYESTDGGVTWPTELTAARGFCGGQCFYDASVAVDPTTSGATLRIYLGGAGSSGSAGGSVIFERSSNNGASFTANSLDLHADTHVIAVDPTTPSTVWLGGDGGVFRSPDGGVTWASRNTTGLGTLQFQSIAVHPLDSTFTLGGTQDNGTELRDSAASWTRADFGDGGYALIDQNASNTTNVTMYHTYFNVTGSLIGFGRVTSVANATDNGWSLLGCTNGVMSNNGIGCGESVNFYAPMALGPGNPNTLYFGTDRLYRSTNSGTNMSAVSQGPIVAGVPISAIGISKQNDNVRIVGLSDGEVFATTTGSNPLTNVTSLSFPSGAYVGRTVIDPNNSNTAYVTFAAYTTAGQGIWKTTNLAGGAATWSPAGNGIPSVPISAFAVDPNNSLRLFAGTDIGVYASTDGGANWAPYGTGLPAVAVFDMAIAQPGTANEKVRIATHGRSIWEAPIGGPTAVDVMSFTPRRGVLMWRTASETSIAGFNVFRNGMKLNRALIPAKHSGQARGATYRYADRGATRGERYRLQALGMDGTSIWRS